MDGGGRSKASAIFFLLLGVAAAITAFGFLALPPVISDLQQFGREMPTRLPGILEKLKSIPFAQHLDTADIVSRLQDFASHAATYLLLSIKDWAGKLFDVVDGCGAHCLFHSGRRQRLSVVSVAFSRRQRERLDRTLQRGEGPDGQMAAGPGQPDADSGGGEHGVYLSLNIRYAYALGVLTGLLNIIPVLGAAICIGLALLVAAIDSWGRVLGVAIFYVICVQC